MLKDRSLNKLGNHQDRLDNTGECSKKKVNVIMLAMCGHLGVRVSPVIDADADAVFSSPLWAPHIQQMRINQLSVFESACRCSISIIS